MLHARDGNGSRWVLFGTGISNNVAWKWEMMGSTWNGNGNKNGNGNGSHWVLFVMGMRMGIGRINAVWSRRRQVSYDGALDVLVVFWRLELDDIFPYARRLLASVDFRPNHLHDCVAYGR